MLLVIYRCVQINSVLLSSSWLSMLVVINKDSLMPGGLCAKLHGGRSQLFALQSTSHRSIANYSSRIAIFAYPPCLLRTEDVHLHTPALRIGTHFLRTLETVVFLFHLLSATSKPFSSLSTRLAHAARLGSFYKTRYINSLLLTY